MSNQEIISNVYGILSYIKPGKVYFEIDENKRIKKYMMDGLDLSSITYILNKKYPLLNLENENYFAVAHICFDDNPANISTIYVATEEIRDKLYNRVFYKSYEDALDALDEKQKTKKHEDSLDALSYIVESSPEIIPRRFTYENGHIVDLLHDKHLDDVMKSAVYLLSQKHPEIIDKHNTFIEDVLKVFDDGIKKKDEEDVHKDVCKYLGLSDDSLKNNSNMIIRVSTFDDKYSWMDEMVEKRKKELESDKFREFIKFKPESEMTVEKIEDICEELKVIKDMTPFFPTIPKIELPVINIPKFNLPIIQLPDKNVVKNTLLGINGRRDRILGSIDSRQEEDTLRLSSAQDCSISDINIEKVNRCRDIDESPDNFVLKVLKDRNNPDKPQQKEFNMSIDLGSMEVYNSKIQKAITEREHLKLLDDIVISYELIKPGFYYKFYNNKQVYVSDITYIKSSQMVYIDLIILARKSPNRNWFLTTPEGETEKMSIMDFLKKFTFESRIYEDNNDLSSDSLIEFNELRYAVEYLKYMQIGFDSTKPLSYFTTYPEMFYFINKTRSNLDITLEEISIVAMDLNHEVEKSTIFFYHDVIDSKATINYKTKQRILEKIEVKDFFNTFVSCYRYDDIFKAEKEYRKMDINFKSIYPIKSDASSPCYMGIQFVKFYNEYGLQDFITHVDSFAINTYDGEFLIYDILKVNNESEIRVRTHNGKIIYIKELDLINKAILIIKHTNTRCAIGTNNSYIYYSDAITPSKENNDGIDSMILKVNWLGLEILSRIYKRAKFLFFNTFTNRYSVISYEKGKIYIDENDDYTSKISCISDNIQDGRLLRLDNDLFEYWTTDYTDGEE